MTSTDKLTNAAQILATAVEAAAAEWDGLTWENGLADVADALESGDARAIDRLDAETIATNVANDGDYDRQRHHARLRTAREALANLDSDDAEAVAELADDFRRLSDEEIAYVEGEAEEAAEFGRDAVEAIRGNNFARAIELLGRACANEGQFGDDPTWRPVLSLAEELAESTVRLFCVDVDEDADEVAVCDDYELALPVGDGWERVVLACESDLDEDDRITGYAPVIEVDAAVADRRDWHSYMHGESRYFRRA